ncbi:hypothetical protein [Streptodolium elevatio]|uniref:Lipopolysaccharide assembly protein A domain-containing protein n=1 Tax=Streptodolium elevatio TaxID=3157996 RepID=A0ABV3DH50_9ACTN
MIFVGLLIAAAAAAFAALLIAYNTSGGPEYTVSMFDQDIVTLNSLAIFVSGLAIALIFCAGLALAASWPRTRRRLGMERTTDAELQARAQRRADTHEWQSDPSVSPVRTSADQATRRPDEPGAPGTRRPDGSSTPGAGEEPPPVR